MKEVTVIYNAFVWEWKPAKSCTTLDQIPISQFISYLKFLVIQDGFIINIQTADENISNLQNILDEIQSLKKSFIIRKVIDANRNLILPGLIDSHIHVGLTGESHYFVDLNDCYSIEDMQNKLKLHLLQYPHILWVQGVNWDQTKLGRYPTRIDLDVLEAVRPIFLWRACWHIGVANTAALVIANISLDGLAEPIVNGGVIDMFPNISDGPSGILRERAVELVTAVMNVKSFDQKRQFISDGLNLCVKSGLTSVQTNDEMSLNVYQMLQKENKLPLRVFLTPCYLDMYQPPENGGVLHLVPITLKSAIDDSHVLDEMSSRLIIDRIKIYTDGSLGAETAALLSNDDISNVEKSNNNVNISYTGLLLHKTEELEAMVRHVRDHDYRIEVHAIGDAAAEQIITIIEKIITVENYGNERPILTHCQVLNENLISRMAHGKGIIANVQPSFVPTDMRWVKNRLSDKKQQYSYVWKSLIKTGVMVAGGSDAPIESPNPFTGMFDAIYRSNRNRIDNNDITEEDVFLPNERLTFQEALWIYTLGGAYASKSEHLLGSIEENYAADLVIVDLNIISNPSMLYQYQPKVVMVGGDISHNNYDSSDSSKNINIKDATDSDFNILSTHRTVEIGANLTDTTEGFKELHDHVFLPGKNGPRPTAPDITYRTTRTSEWRRSTIHNDGLSCACLLRGIYCLDSI
eukprot:gene13210-17703_t